MSSNDRLDKVVAEARRARDVRDRDYRERALKMYPWICGRCSREFERLNIKELTVHHRDHNHANNPQDGSNWELLCVYCHDNEHQKQLEFDRSGPAASEQDEIDAATFKPFAGLEDLLKK